MSANTDQWRRAVRLLLDPNSTDESRVEAADSLACSDTRGQNAIRKLKGIPALISLLISEDSELVRSLVAALVSLTCDNHRNMVAVRAARGIPRLVNLLSSASQPVLKKVLMLIDNIAEPRFNRRAIRRSGGIIALINLLSHSNDEIVEWAAIALRAVGYNYTTISPMISDSINRRAIINADGVSALVSAFDSQRVETRRAAVNALDVLRYIKFFSSFCPPADNRDAIRLGGGIPPLVKLLKDPDETVRRRAAFTLIRLAWNWDDDNNSGNTANQTAILRAGGIRLLREAQVSFDHLVELVTPGPYKDEETITLKLPPGTVLVTGNGDFVRRAVEQIHGPQ